MPPVNQSILSEYDQSVLNAILNPCEQGNNLTGIYDEELPESLQGNDGMNI